MENMNEFVTEVTENVEPTTEEVVEQVETPKVYTEEEFKAKLTEGVNKGVRRREAKIRKEYERKYGNLESVLKAGTGKENVDEMTDTFREFYQSKGIQMPSEPTYSARDISVLASAEAEDIIQAGFDEVVEEVDRLADIGLENMNAREKEVFRRLAEYRKSTEQGQALAKIGVTKDVYTSKEFTEFASKFSANTPVTEVYEIYKQMQPRKEIRTMGSMKSNTTQNAGNGIKDHYTYEEAKKFTKQDFDKNPKLYEAVQKSMLEWK
jgi:hypothetical protein